MIGPEQLTSATSVARPIAFGFAALAGLAAAFGPSSYPLVPAVIGYEVARDERRGPAIARALWIVAGMLVVTAAVGALAGAFGLLVARWLADRLALTDAFTAIVMLVLGLRFLGILRFRVAAGPFREARAGAPWWEPLALGGTFALAACPACTPLLLAVVLGAAAIGSVPLGALLLAMFALGRGVPIIALGLSARLFRNLRLGVRAARWFDIAGGALLVGTALYYGVQAWSVWSGTMDMRSAAAMSHM